MKLEILNNKNNKTVMLRLDARDDGGASIVALDKAGNSVEFLCVHITEYYSKESAAHIYMRYLLNEGGAVAKSMGFSIGERKKVVIE